MDWSNLSNNWDGGIIDQEKDVSLFLDEMSLAAAQLVHRSRLKIKTRLFLDQQPTLTAK